jgi:hypothetical protein
VLGTAVGLREGEADWLRNVAPFEEALNLLWVVSMVVAVWVTESIDAFSTNGTACSVGVMTLVYPTFRLLHVRSRSVVKTIESLSPRAGCVAQAKVSFPVSAL